jgi:hypothetical protein
MAFFEKLAELQGILDDHSDAIGDGDYLRAANIMRWLHDNRPRGREIPAAAPPLLVRAMEIGAGVIPRPAPAPAPARPSKVWRNLQLLYGDEILVNTTTGVRIAVWRTDGAEEMRADDAGVLHYVAPRVMYTSPTELIRAFGVTGNGWERCRVRRRIENPTGYTVRLETLNQRWRRLYA